MRWALILLAPVLTACVGAPASPPPTTYDFGLGASAIAVDQRLPGALAIADVTAPAWLSGDGIIYRLAYDNAARPEIYSQSRWVAPPPALLTQLLRQQLAAVAAGGVVEGDTRVAVNYLLRVELEEFSQVFDSRDHSHVVVRARASLFDLRQDTLLAQEEFTTERPASPDAAGAAGSLRDASHMMLRTMAGWLTRVGRGLDLGR